MQGRSDLSVLVVLLVVGSLAGVTDAFLATALNYSDPDVANIFCSDETLLREGWDHESITQEGVRRNIRKFFLTYPPPHNPGLTLPPDASLSQLFHLYYGDSASPTRFIKAVNSIARDNINTDSSYQLRYDTTLHGDGEGLDEMHKKLTIRYPQILSSILIQESYSAARSLLGLSLHSIQDFYSHSTWVEQGHRNIFEGLGLPGYSLDGLAGETEDVCTPCRDSEREACLDNVVGDAGLSSGYYTYTTEAGVDYLVPKPPTGGKCSHGGTLDDSANEPPKGGINKDTASACFSPHYYLHEEAAELAVQATTHYLDQVLEAVGYDKYRRLFDLYLGSALSICIDTTGSMTDDIDAVKQQVNEIVANSSPELYILSQFNDPSCGPVFKTTDGEEFLKAVNALDANGGGDFPELFWCGLQLALSETPNYGDVFCFTDADAKDGERMDGVISQAQRQDNKVTVILSDLLEKKPNTEGDNEKDDDDGDDDDDDDDASDEDEGSVRDLVTSLEEFEYLTDATGGLLINAAKFDVSDIVGIMTSGVETSTVTVLQQEVRGVKEILFPVDESLRDFELRLSGLTHSGLLFDPTGTRYDLMNEAELAAAGVEIVTFTNNFKALRWTGPNIGSWKLDVAPTLSATVTVVASSSLDFLATFSLLDATPPHPHYRPTEAQPLMDTVYYIEVTLVGHRESKVALVSSVEFIDKDGGSLRTIDYPMEVRDQAYLWTHPLPIQPFYVRLHGSLASANKWMRQMPVQVWPVETLVELYSTTEELEAPPGENASAKFLIVNYGLESFFDIKATDDLNFLVDVIPSRVFLGTNQTTVVEVKFEVPMWATHGQISTVIVTARSETQKNSFNSALAHFFVLPLEADTTPPTCVLDSYPVCEGYNNNGLCNTRFWDVRATLQDHGSGLYAVSYAPDGTNVLVSHFTPGTHQEVYVLYQADCCTTNVRIRGTDGQANVGSCEVIDTGTVGGLIYYFEVEAVGGTWLAAHWNISSSSLPVSHFRLMVDGSLVNTVPCHEESCYALLSYLEPCTTYHLNVTPVFSYNGEDLEGLGAYTEGTTLEDEPKTPVNGRELDATTSSITIIWEAANPMCTFMYEVCVYEVGADPAAAVCHTTVNTFLRVEGLGECRAYMNDVRALAASSEIPPSSPLTFYTVTLCTEIP